MGYRTTDTLINLTAGPVTGLTITLEADCTHDREKAESDIKNGEAKLLLVGSIAPVYYPNQRKFEKKYKVKYFDFGCTPPAYECIEEYNKRVFKYLDSKYGRKWREEVRQDVEYLKEKQ